MTARGKAAQAVRAMPSATAPLQNLRTILASRMWMRFASCRQALLFPLLLAAATSRGLPLFLSLLAGGASSFLSEESLVLSREREPGGCTVTLARITCSLARSLARWYLVRHQGSSNSSGWLAQGPSPREHSASAALCLYAWVRMLTARRGRSHHPLCSLFLGIFLVSRSLGPLYSRHLLLPLTPVRKDMLSLLNA